MTAAHKARHKGREVGNLKFDRRFGNLGRICRSSGTADARVFRELNAMLTTLHETGRTDILKGVRDGWLRPLEVWSAFRFGRLGKLPTAKHVMGLTAAVNRWAKRFKASEQHRASCESLLTRLAVPKATVADLPALLGDFQDQCRKAGTARTFNLARAACEAFLRDTVGRADELWAEVNRLPTLTEDKRQGKKLTVAEVSGLAAELEGRGLEWWSLCLTGMRTRSEYFAGQWEQSDDRISIWGTKTKAARRQIPLIYAIARPRIGYWGFVQAIRKASAGTVRPYDARHTCMGWMQDAGIPRIRRKIYLGHKVGHDVSELYEAGEVDRYLKEDADKMREHVGETMDKALRLVG
jgi:integrase